MLFRSDGEDVRDIVPHDPRITLVSLLETRRPQFLSDKFNLCCTLGKGEILCKWDDDDWSAPNRISDQVNRLQTSGRAFTGYCKMLFTDGSKWWRYNGTSAFALGTSFCFKREWWDRNKFPPSVMVGSDNIFVHNAVVALQLAAVPGEGMMVATVHPRNTSPKGTTRWQALPDFPGVEGYRSPLVRSKAS